MKLHVLIAQLLAYRDQHGNDLEVMLSVTQHGQDDLSDEETYHGDITHIDVEQNHGSEDLFVRISGDNKE